MPAPAAGIAAQLARSALPDERAIGLIWPQAPGVEQVCALIAAAHPGERVGYLDPCPVLLPWHNIRHNLALAGPLPAAAPLIEAMLAAMDLCAFARSRPARLTPFQRLALGLGRAMLAYPGLLVIDCLRRHRAAAGDLRRLCRIEADLGHLTGCRRLHLAENLADTEVFCSFFINADTMAPSRERSS